MSVNAPAPKRADDVSARISARLGADPEIVVGLINIMPIAAMKTVENLFRCLLDAFASPYKIRLRLFALRNRSNPDAETQDLPQYYEGLNELWDSPNSKLPLDALIVTGTESRARWMQDEPCWPDLQKICDWAGTNTISTIWSCFSAHAAVLHMDNIHRQPFSEKLTGIFECERASNHPILKNMPPRWMVPHSRYNNLKEADLEAHQYEILSRSPSAGADSFTKQHKDSQFLFLQGHLEYGAEMLFSEYCRDLKRFALGQSTVRPQCPENYFDQAAIEALAAIEKAMQSRPDAPPAAEFVDAVTASLNNNWREPAQQLFTTWLSYVAEEKQTASRETASSEISFGVDPFKASRPSDTHGHIAQA